MVVLMSYTTRVLALTLSLVMLIGASTFEMAGGAELQGDDQKESLVTMDFYDVDIAVFIKFISELTGKKFVLDRNVKGTVNVISPTPLTKEGAYKVFESVLEVHGYTTVPAGDIIKVVPLNQAKDKGLETMVTKTRVSEGEGVDKMVTRLIPLRYAEPTEIQTLLTPLISKNGVLAAHQPTNTLIVTDVDSNIVRLLQIIREIDVPDFSMKISVIPLKHAAAEDLGKKLSELLEESTKGDRSVTQARPVGQTNAKKIKIIPIERTNTLIVLATLDDTQKIKKLVEQLDQPTPTGRDLIHVYYLKNAVAEDVCTVLGGLKKESEKDQKNGKPVLSKDVTITPDKATNSIVARATPEEYRTICQVIQKLDIPRAMVYVEGLIVEATTEKAMRLGVEWNVGNDFNNEQGFWFGGTNAGTTGALGSLVAGVQTKDAALTLPPGFALGVLGENITFGDVTFPTIAALINAVSTDTDFNILSTPQILTTDNVEAEVKVAQNIPFLTRVDLGTETTSRAIQSFEYKDIGVVLKVTPQINQDRYVRLTIEEEVKNVVQAQTQTSQGELLLAPTTNVRSAKTTVIVKDGETVVLGGLIQDLRQGNEVRTPCLGEIPLVGALFRSTSENKGKTNLLVFLSPHIVENTEEARQLYLKKNQELEKLRLDQKTLQKNDGKAPNSMEKK
jgi:general secretion pathway protein D